MSSFLKTLILRHKKENVKKCSLRGLETREDLCFFTYPKDALPDLSDVVLLTIHAQELSKNDRNKQLLLIDGTWKYAKAMELFVSKQGPIEKRSLPIHFRTVYPRKQTDCEDPKRGLASVEALFLAHRILGKNVDGLLDSYYWKEAFYKRNHLP